MMKKKVIIDCDPVRTNGKVLNCLKSFHQDYPSIGWVLGADL